MVSKADVRRIALALPGVREQEDHFGFGVPAGDKYKAFAWAWRERVDPRKARAPNERVLAIRVADLDAKEAMLMSSSPSRITMATQRCWCAWKMSVARSCVVCWRRRTRSRWRRRSRGDRRRNGRRQRKAAAQLSGAAIAKKLLLERLRRGEHLLDVFVGLHR
jgi:hypothetical protein